MFHAVYDGRDGVDGRVSIEVAPRLAHDTDARPSPQAQPLWDDGGPPQRV